MDRVTRGGDAVLEVTTDELARLLESGDGVHVVDVRAPDQVALGRVEPVPAGRFHAVPGARLLEASSLEPLGLAAGTPAVVVCARGVTSARAAAHLSALGCPARSLRGGMAAWMALTVPRDVAPPPTLDRLVQFDRPGKAALGHLLVSDGEALVIDPPRGAGAYVEVARQAGARIVGVADTHVHADYISGAAALSRALGVPYHLHPADAVYPYDGTPGRLDFQPLRDGDGIRVGRSRVRVRHTPGHTEGSVTYMVDDAVALTGDFVFVDSIGRPDLAGRTAEWAAKLEASLAAARRDWPRGLLVLPGHYATESERRADRTVAATFGELLGSNAVLRLEGEAFVRWVVAREARFPEVYRRIKALNVGLLVVDDLEADEIDNGKNACAVGGG
jgi:glyoxylase-like metal-dependent hydrolase (beta-lactamase superfamily II)